MKFEDVHSYKFEDRGFGYCVVWVDKFHQFDRRNQETALNAVSLFSRICNLGRLGLDTTFERWAFSEVVRLDARKFWRKRDVDFGNRFSGILNTA